MKFLALVASPIPRLDYPCHAKRSIRSRGSNSSESSIVPNVRIDLDGLNDLNRCLVSFITRTVESLTSTADSVLIPARPAAPCSGCTHFLWQPGDTPSRYVACSFFDLKHTLRRCRCGPVRSLAHTHKNARRLRRLRENMSTTVLHGPAYPFFGQCHRRIAR